jgi:glucans biosynthesis protein C
VSAGPPARTAIDAPPGRRSDLDALRLLAVLLLFVFHTAKVFDGDPAYHVKSPAFEEPGTMGAAASAVSWWIRRWQMPLLFAIAGWASVVSIRRHGVRRFLARRALRLGAPLALGVVLLCPPIKWLELAQGRTLRPSGLRLVPASELPPLELLSRFFGRLDHFTWSHLWFLAYLLVFTLAAVPFLRVAAAGRAGGRRAPGALVALLPAVPLASLELALRPRFGDHPNLYSDWANVATFSAYFLLGATLAARPQIEEALRRARGLACGLLLAATVAAAVVVDPLPRIVAGAVVGWSAVACALGCAPALRWPRPLAAPAWRRSALAVFVLHHTPLLWIAWAVTRSDLPPAAQAFSILLGAAAATALLVTLAARWGPARRALGLAVPA